MSVQLNIPMADYLAIDAFSSGIAHRVITQSPRHALYSRVAPRGPSTVSNKGEIAHKLLLEGNEDGIVSVAADNWKTKAAQTERDTAYAEGKIPILDREMPPIRVMVSAAKNCVAESSEIAGVFEDGNPEVTVTWDDDGLPCKIRPDFLSNQWHISVKTTNVVGGANPRYWTRTQLTPSGYDMQMQFYRRGLIANGIDVEHRFLVIEQNPPYGCSIIALAPNKAAIADVDVERSINIWRECLATNVFPGYPTGTFWAEAASWELAAAEERELEILVGA